MNFKLSDLHKRNWVRALRSGKFKQGRSSLRHTTSNDEVEYCCLGVACEIKITQDGKHPIYGKNFYVDVDFLPLNIQEQLVIMNDVHKYNFNEIADWIEQNL